jgi:hypothetical protein
LSQETVSALDRGVSDKPYVWAEIEKFDRSDQDRWSTLDVNSKVAHGHLT